MAAGPPRRDSRSWARRARGTSPRSCGWPSPRGRTRTPSRGRARLLGEEGRGFVQDVAFFAQHPVLAPQPRQLATLISRQTIVAAALIEISLLDPVPQRLRGHAEIICDLRQRPIAGSDKTNRLNTKLRRIRRGNSLTRHKDYSPEGVDSQR